MLYEETTSDLIAAYYPVYNTLGYGFLEKVYENALAVELTKRNHAVQQQMPVQVFYDGKIVGDYFADMVVDDQVIVELKAADEIAIAHEAQLVNYLKATKFQVGLLFNFGPKPAFKRKIYSSRAKTIKYPRKSV